VKSGEGRGRSAAMAEPAASAMSAKVVRRIFIEYIEALAQPGQVLPPPVNHTGAWLRRKGSAIF